MKSFNITLEVFDLVLEQADLHLLLAVLLIHVFGTFEILFQLFEAMLFLVVDLLTAHILDPQRVKFLLECSIFPSQFMDGLIG